MWYHYLVALVALYFLYYGVMSIVRSGFTITAVVFAAVSAYALYWSYSGITAPPPMFGGRR